MIRIGRIRFEHSENPDHPLFRLVIENGRITLGCWRFSHWEGNEYDTAVFERVS